MSSEKLGVIARFLRDGRGGGRYAGVGFVTRGDYEHAAWEIGRGKPRPGREVC
jgi:hypothetical protein